MNYLWFRAARIIVLVCLSKVLLSHQEFQDPNIKMLYKWKTVEFNYPTFQARNDAISQGEFIPGNTLILESDIHVQGSKERHFVTTPPLQPGIPATLSQVIRKRGEILLEPFPSWPNKTDLCSGPVAVFRTFIDKCGLMWVLDTDSQFLKGICPPKLLVYDLNDGDREVLRYEFPEQDIYDRSFLLTIVVESYKSDCSDSIAYIADMQEHGLIVFDYATRTSWRTENRLFLPYPAYTWITSNGDSIEFMDGIFGLALGPPWQRDRKLYFHSLASLRESWVPVSVLKNQTALADPLVQRTAFVESPGKRSGQSTVEVMTDDGILLYSQIPNNELVCWNSNDPFIRANQHVLLRDEENLQYINGLKLKKNNTLIITSCRLIKYSLGLLDENDYNYRVMVVKDVRLLLQNSPCSNNWSGRKPLTRSSEVDVARKSSSKNFQRCALRSC